MKWSLFSSPQTYDVTVSQRILKFKTGNAAGLHMDHFFSDPTRPEILLTRPDPTFGDKNKDHYILLMAKYVCMYMYVCMLRTRVQPTLDSYAEAFL